MIVPAATRPTSSATCAGVTASSASSTPASFARRASSPEPPLAGVGGRGAGGDGVADQVDGAGVDQPGHLRRRDAPLLGQPGAPGGRQLGQRRGAASRPTPRRARSAPGRARGSTGSRSPPPCCGPDDVLPVSSWKCRVSCTTRPPSSRTAAWRRISKRTARSTERSELTFLVSVRVPHSRLPIGASEMLTSQRRLPCSIRTSETPSVRTISRSSVDVGAGHLGGLGAGAGDRAGDDLDQRDAGPVVVDQRVVGAVDAPGGATDVQVLAGVLLQVHPLDLHAVGLAVDLDVQVPGGAQRLVVLGGLEALGDVRVEVVLPGEPAPGRDPAAEREPDPDRRLDRRRVGHRQRAGQAQADRAGLRVRARRRRWSSSRRTSWTPCRARRGSPGR